MELLMIGLDLTRQLYVERATKCSLAFLQMDEKDQAPGRVWEFIDYPMRVGVEWVDNTLTTTVTMLEDDMKTEASSKPAIGAAKAPAAKADKKVPARKKASTAKKKAKPKAKAKAKTKVVKKTPQRRR